MILDDLINDYLFNYVSTMHRTDINKKMCGCCSMVEEMNQILKDYKSKTKTINEILWDCVCVRHGHQYCISNDAVNAAVAALLESEVMLANLHQYKPFVSGKQFVKGFVDFEELYDFVCSVIGKINGIGPLTVYDTAKRIGHLLTPAIYPKQYVYLAAGALEGAKMLLGDKKLKFREPIKRFEPYFGTLGSLYIEDILCIYKADFVLGSKPLKSFGKANAQQCNYI
ncbi:MAG: hypothetical protein J6R91_02765 [Bacteroidaceae bacterium]|nr:hypothetical protein [Bacteroidaceae bacterium]